MSVPVTARAIRSNRPAGSGRWLSLGPASRLIGVDPDTLRRWANEGRVEVFVTPGRHRRFDRRSLEGMTAGARRDAGPLASLGASPERVTRAYRRAYTSDAPARRISADDAGDRERYRQDGRRLVEALIAHLDADRADEVSRRDTEARAVVLVDGLADRVRARGLTVSEAIALFVAARRPFLAELAGLAGRRTLDPARLGELYDDAVGLLDRLLLHFVDTYLEASR